MKIWKLIPAAILAAAAASCRYAQGAPGRWQRYPWITQAQTALRGGSGWSVVGAQAACGEP
jgi:hypothetical protein